MSLGREPARVSSAAAPAARRFDGTPAAPDFPIDRGGPTAGPRPGHGPGVGRGTKRDQRDAVSLSTGLAPKRHPTSSRPPPGRRPRSRRNRLTTRPAREPCLTGLSPGEIARRSSNGHGAGNGCVSGPAGTPLPAQPPGPAGPGRRSPHECWVRLVRGLRGQESRLPPIAKPGRRGCALPTAAVTPEKRRQEERRSPWPWKLFSLDSENLMNSRAAARPDRPVNGAGHSSRPDPS
jgi:hypothetical protein